MSLSACGAKRNLLAVINKSITNKSRCVQLILITKTLTQTEDLARASAHAHIHLRRFVMMRSHWAGPIKSTQHTAYAAYNAIAHLLSQFHYVWNGPSRRSLAHFNLKFVTKTLISDNALFVRPQKHRCPIKPFRQFETAAGNTATILPTKYIERLKYFLKIKIVLLR